MLIIPFFFFFGPSVKFLQKQTNHVLYKDAFLYKENSYAISFWQCFKIITEGVRNNKGEY